MVPLHFYRCTQPLSLYKTPAQDSLVTQIGAGGCLWILPLPPGVTDWQTLGAIAVCLWADDYPGWLALGDAAALVPIPAPAPPPPLSPGAIAQAIPKAIAFAQAAHATPNTYRWGGTLAPDYDCSGLMQAAFGAAGIPIPRDAYQQRQWATPVELGDLQPGDLLFFGQGDRTTHVGLHLGQGRYLHSSGASHGRNGIGIDHLWQPEHPVSRHYAAQYQGAGRITQIYQPTGIPWLQRDGSPFFPWHSGS